MGPNPFFHSDMTTTDKTTDQRHRAQAARELNSAWAKLARVLRLPRRQLDLLRAAPDAPATPDADAWRVHLAKLAPGHATAAAAVPRTLEEAKLARVLVQIELDQVRLARTRGELVPIEEIHALHAHVIGGMVSTFRQRIENDLPLQTEGKSVPEIRKLARDAVDETLRTLQKGLEEWDARREKELAEATT
jgi:hypothetical protein